MALIAVVAIAAVGGGGTKVSKGFRRTQVAHCSKEALAAGRGEAPNSPSGDQLHIPHFGGVQRL